MFGLVHVYVSTWSLRLEVPSSSASESGIYLNCLVDPGRVCVLKAFWDENEGRCSRALNTRLSTKHPPPLGWRTQSNRMLWGLLCAWPCIGCDEGIIRSNQCYLSVWGSCVCACVAEDWGCHEYRNLCLGIFLVSSGCLSNHC